MAIVATMLSRGFDDPAALLWMVMLTVQTMPYFSTVLAATLSAQSNAQVQPSAAVLPLPLAKPDPEPVLPKAA